jgi:hypothetical protein
LIWGDIHMFQQQSKSNASHSASNSFNNFIQSAAAGKTSSYINQLQQTIGNRRTMQMLTSQSNTVIQRVGGKNTNETQDAYLTELKKEVVEASSGHDDGHNFAKGKLEYTVFKRKTTKFDTGVYKSGGTVEKPLRGGFNYRDFAGKGKYPTQKNDSEVQIFQEIDNQLVKEKNSKITGELTLVSTKGSCTSCQIVARKFKDRWPGINIDINYIDPPAVVAKDFGSIHYGEEEDRGNINKATGMFNYRVESTENYNKRKEGEKEKKENTKQSQIDDIQQKIPEWITEEAFKKFKSDTPFGYLSGLNDKEKANQFIDYLKLMNDITTPFPNSQWIKNKKYDFEVLRQNFK